MEDLKKLDISVLLLHGGKDQIVSIGASAELGVKLLKKGTLKVHPLGGRGAHTLHNTEIEMVNRNSLYFLKA